MPQRFVTIERAQEDLEILFSYLEHFKYMSKESIERIRDYLLLHNTRCPNCGFTDKYGPPKTVGTCPCGCVKYSAFDKKLGMRHCVICGKLIQWNE